MRVLAWLSVLASTAFAGQRIEALVRLSGYSDNYLSMGNDIALKSGFQGTPQDLVNWYMYWPSTDSWMQLISYESGSWGSTSWVAYRTSPDLVTSSDSHPGSTFPLLLCEEDPTLFPNNCPKPTPPPDAAGRWEADIRLIGYDGGYIALGNDLAAISGFSGIPQDLVGLYMYWPNTDEWMQFTAYESGAFGTGSWLYYYTWPGLATSNDAHWGNTFPFILCENPEVCTRTMEPTTAEPTSTEMPTARPTTAEPTTAEPTTAEPTTARPTTAEPTTAARPLADNEEVQFAYTNADSLFHYEFAGGAAQMCSFNFDEATAITVRSHITGIAGSPFTVTVRPGDAAYPSTGSFNVEHLLQTIGENVDARGWGGIFYKHSDGTEGIDDWSYWNKVHTIQVTVPTVEPTTARPTTAEPTTADPTTARPTVAGHTAEPTTIDPTTATPTTADPTTAEPTVAGHTAEPTTADPTTADPTTARLITVELTTVETTEEDEGCEDDCQSDDDCDGEELCLLEDQSGCKVCHVVDGQTTTTATGDSGEGGPTTNGAFSYTVKFVSALGFSMLILF